MASSSIMSEPSPSAETSNGGRVVVRFAGNAKYLVGGGKLKGVQVRRVADGQRMASMEAEGVLCLDSSHDHKWIAAGTARGELLMWNAETYERVLEHHEPLPINRVVFFSATGLLSSTNRRTLLWDIPSGKQLQTVDHEAGQSAVGYFARTGIPFAATTENSVRVYDSRNGRLLVDIPVRVTSPFLPGFDDHIFVISNDTIKQLDVSTGSTVAEWPITYSEHSCITLIDDGKFIAYSAKHTVTFWDTSTHTQSCLMERPLEISYIAFSPDDQFLAICGLDGEVTIQDLKDGLPSCYSAAPCIHIADTALEGCLVDAEAPLADAISTSRYQGNHAPNRSKS